jgi:hypothetical protein
MKNDISPFGPDAQTTAEVWRSLSPLEQAMRRAETARQEAASRHAEAQALAVAERDNQRQIAHFLEKWDDGFKANPMWDTQGKPVAWVTTPGESYGSRMSLNGGYDEGGRAPDKSHLVRRDGSSAVGDVVARGRSGEEWSLRGLGIINSATSQWLPDNARTIQQNDEANLRHVKVTDEASRWLAFNGGRYHHGYDGDGGPVCWDNWVSPEIKAARAKKVEKKGAQQAMQDATSSNPFAALAVLVTASKNEQSTQASDGTGGGLGGEVLLNPGPPSVVQSFDNASGNFNPDLDQWWIKQGQKEINGEGMSDAEYHTAVAEYANSWRIGELLEKMGWRRRGSSNVSASSYYQKDIELDEENEDGDDTLTYEVRVSDHEDRHGVDVTIEKRFQVNFRMGTAQWSDLDISPDMSNDDALYALSDSLKFDQAKQISGDAEGTPCDGENELEIKETP